jgi:hypothetical protein
MNCDQRSLNRAVDTCVIAIKEQRKITDESLQVNLQFLSERAIDEENFKKFLDEQKFSDLCSKAEALVAEFSTLSDFVTKCDAIFQKEGSLKKAQAYILLEHIISKLEIVKDSGGKFVPLVFD